MPVQELFARTEKLDGLDHRVCKIAVEFSRYADPFSFGPVGENNGKVLQNHLFTVTQNVINNEISQVGKKVKDP